MTEPENKDRIVMVGKHLFRGCGFSCSCGYESMTREAMEQHRATCDHNPEVWLRMQENDQYMEACRKGKLDV